MFHYSGHQELRQYWSSLHESPFLLESRSINIQVNKRLYGLKSLTFETLGIEIMEVCLSMLKKPSSQWVYVSENFPVIYFSYVIRC